MSWIVILNQLILPLLLLVWHKNHSRLRNTEQHQQYI